MSYALLWIETLLACLLYAAMFIALGLRVQRRWLRITVLVVALLVPLVFPLGLIAGISLGLYVITHGYNLALVWVLVLVLGYVLGTLLVLWLALRRDETQARRGAAWPRGRLYLSLALALGLMVMTLWSISLAAHEELERLRLQAIVLAMQVTPAPVPDSLNAWLLYQQADAQLQAIPDHQKEEEKIYADGVDAGGPEVAAYLQRREQALALIRRAADMPNCRVDIDFLNLMDRHSLDSLAAFRRSANLLALAARAEVAKGDIDAAVADVSHLYAMGLHSADANPILIGQLVMFSIQALASQTLITSLPHVTDPAQLTALHFPDDQTITRTTARCMRGDEAVGTIGFTGLVEGNFNDPVLKTPPYRLLPLTWTLWLKQEYLSYRNFTHQVQSLSLLPPWERYKQSKQLDNDILNGKTGGIATKILVPAVGAIFRTVGRSESLRAAAKVAMAATKYRLDHGNQYPATGQELVPQYLDAWLVDPFDGKPLRYLRHEDGTLTIYSVGDDLQDDGGKIDRPDDQHRAPDEGYRLPLPPAR